MTLIKNRCTDDYVYAIVSIHGVLAFNISNSDAFSSYADLFRDEELKKEKSSDYNDRMFNGERTNPMISVEKLITYFRDNSCGVNVMYAPYQGEGEIFKWTSWALNVNKELIDKCE